MRKRLVTKIAAAAATAAMAASLLTGCGGASGTTQTAAGDETTESTDSSASAQDDGVVTLTILAQKLSSNVTDYPDTHVLQEMANKIGVKLSIVEADTDKYNVMLASGDGFDLILAPTTKFTELIEGNIVQPMDSYLEAYGQDMTANVPDTVEFSKGAWSNGTGSLYFMPMQVGVDANGAYQQMGLLTRWDYYKEMGCPEINDLDEWLQLLADMQAAHPTTEDGLPVYGVSMFTDWNVWCYKYPLACVLGYNELSGAASGLYKPSTMEYENLYAKDGLFWASVEYYYKANQLGILDPDAFITKYDDFTAKGTNGQLLTAPAYWATGNFNADHSDEAVGFAEIPTTWANQWGNTDYKAGWVDKCLGISAKTANPEKCMQYINYIFSYDGARELYSGVEGVDYTVEDGVPVLTQESKDLYVAGGDAWKESGLGFDCNITGLQQYAVDPDDGKTLNLFMDPDIYPEMLNTAQKDFCEYYGVDYPQEIFDQYREKYGTTDQSGTDAFTVALVEAAPDDITRIEASLQETAISAASKLILAADDAEYAQIKAETEAEFEEIGLQEVIDWYTNAWNTAKEQAAQYK